MIIAHLLLGSEDDKSQAGVWIERKSYNRMMNILA